MPCLLHTIEQVLAKLCEAGVAMSKDQLWPGSVTTLDGLDWREISIEMLMARGPEFAQILERKGEQSVQ